MSSELDAPLGPGVVEALVLDASREFYDNSMSGNMHTGGMKLAYDWYVLGPSLNSADPSQSRGGTSDTSYTA